MNKNVESHGVVHVSGHIISYGDLDGQMVSYGDMDGLVFRCLKCSEEYAAPNEYPLLSSERKKLLKYYYLSQFVEYDCVDDDRSLYDLMLSEINKKMSGRVNTKKMRDEMEKQLGEEFLMNFDIEENDSDGVNVNFKW